MAKKRFLQHVQKPEHIKLRVISNFHAAQRKLLPKFNFFGKNPQKLIQG